MGVNFKTLVDILNIDAPVHFVPSEKIDKRNYVFCKFMSSEETNAIINGTHDSTIMYDDSELGLYFPELELYEYFEIEKARNPVGIENRISDISFQMKINIIDIPIVFATYCVLHEYGHWLYFKETGLTSYEYCEQEKRERQPYEEKFQEIYNMTDSDPYKRYLAKEFDKDIYSKFTSEHAANEYALKHIQTAVKKVFKYLNNVIID